MCIRDSLKSIYFADKRHLLDFGRRLHDDEYVAMKDGPVGNHAYDLFNDVKKSRTDRSSFQIANGQFSVGEDGMTINPLRSFNPETFSDSEISCLKAAISLCSQLSFAQLRDLSHDEGYDAADPNGAMQMDAIIGAMEGGEEALPHLREQGLV